MSQELTPEVKAYLENNDVSLNEAMSLASTNPKTPEEWREWEWLQLQQEIANDW